LYIEVQLIRAYSLTTKSGLNRESVLTDTLKLAIFGPKLVVLLAEQAYYN